MIVDDFDIESVALAPSEANPPLVIDADAVLTSAVARELLKSIPWGNSQIRNCTRGIEDREFPVGRTLKIRRKPAHSLPREYGPGTLPQE